MSAALSLQKALGARLAGSPAVTALVPACNILDRNSRPAPNPSIILGEDQAMDEGGFARTKQRIIHTVHIWKEESGLGGAKAIASAIREAVMRGAPMRLPDGYHLADIRVSGERFMRDPGGDHSHGVVTLDALVAEA